MNRFAVYSEFVYTLKDEITIRLAETLNSFVLFRDALQRQYSSWVEAFEMITYGRDHAVRSLKTCDDVLLDNFYYFLMMAAC